SRLYSFCRWQQRDAGAASAVGWRGSCSGKDCRMHRGREFSYLPFRCFNLHQNFSNKMICFSWQSADHLFHGAIERRITENITFFQCSCGIYAPALQNEFGLRADHPCSQFEKQGRGGETEIMSCGLSQGTHEFRIRNGTWRNTIVDAFLTIVIQPSYHACNVRHVYPADVLFSVALLSTRSEVAEVEEGD